MAGVEGIIDSFDALAWEDITRIGPTSRAAEECWKHWTHQLRPSLNKGPWFDEEDARLLQLVKRLGTHAVSLHACIPFAVGSMLEHASRAVKTGQWPHATDRIICTAFT